MEIDSLKPGISTIYEHDLKFSPFFLRIRARVPQILSDFDFLWDDLLLSQDKEGHIWPQMRDEPVVGPLILAHEHWVRTHVPEYCHSRLIARDTFSTNIDQ